MTEKFNESLAALTECAALCDICATACLREKDVANLVDCIRADLDCADMCRATAAVLARGGDHLVPMCRLCAELCAHCAEHCEMHADKYEHCRACAKSCRQAQEECEAIVA